MDPPKENSTTPKAKAVAGQEPIEREKTPSSKRSRVGSRYLKEFSVQSANVEKAVLGQEIQESW
jgi:hypothetical protein